MLLAAGVLFVVFGLTLFAWTMGKPPEWTPPVSRIIWAWGWPSDRGRDKLRAMAYIVTAFGALNIIRVLWLGA